MVSCRQLWNVDAEAVSIIMNFIHEIYEAFSSREKPVNILVDTAANTFKEDYEDALFFSGKTNKEIICDDLERHPSCVFWFSPKAYLYFLPGIFSATYTENRPDILVVSSIIMTLDRSNTPNTWDDFFAKRWVLLTKNECHVTQKWLLWLSQFDGLSFDEISLGRAFDTIDLLSGQSSAYPIAKFSSEL